MTLRGHSSEVWACAFSPDGAKIISGSWDGTLIIWDSQKGAELMTLEGHENLVSTCAFSPDGGCIISGSWDEILMVWDVKSGEKLGEFRLNGVHSCMNWRMGSLLAFGTNTGSVQILRLINVPFGPSIVTAWKKTEQDIAFGCPHCRAWSALADLNLGHLISCPKCGKLLKLNPFTISADWRPVAAAWKKKLLKQ